jgi:hypothetical protein
MPGVACEVLCSGLSGGTIHSIVQRVRRGFHWLAALVGMSALMLSAVSIPHAKAATADRTFEFLSEFVRELREQERISAAGQEQAAKASTQCWRDRAAFSSESPWQPQPALRAELFYCP